MGVIAILQLTDRILEYNLVGEDKGFIFRCKNESNHGLNGHHETKQLAIISVKLKGIYVTTESKFKINISKILE